jgi:hypothetical protein
MWNKVDKPTTTWARGIEYLATEALKYLLTEDDKFIITERVSDIKVVTAWTKELKI